MAARDIGPWVSAGPRHPTTATAAPIMFFPELSWIYRLQFCVMLLWLCTIWTHQAVLPLTPGWPRLLAAAPAVAAFIVAPFLFHPFSEPLLTMTITFMSVRMPLTKLLAACYGRGPIIALPLNSETPDGGTSASQIFRTYLYRKLRLWVQRQPRSRGGNPAAKGEGPTRAAMPDLAMVTFFMLCPVVPRARRTTAGRDAGNKELICEGRTAAVKAYGCTSNDLSRTNSCAYSARGDRSRLLRELAGKWLAFAVASALAVRYESTAPLALHAALAYGMLAIMGGLMDLTALYCTVWWGVDLVPPFHRPFQATSLADFWSRRWNVTQSRVLKGLLYDPIVEGCLVPRGEPRDVSDSPRDRGGGDGGGSSGGGSGGCFGNVVKPNPPPEGSHNASCSNAASGDSSSGDCAAPGANFICQAVPLIRRKRLSSIFAVQNHQRNQEVLIRRGAAAANAAVSEGTLPLDGDGGDGANSTTSCYCSASETDSNGDGGGGRKVRPAGAQHRPMTGRKSGVSDENVANRSPQAPSGTTNSQSPEAPATPVMSAASGRPRTGPGPGPQREAPPGADADGKFRSGGSGASLISTRGMDVSRSPRCGNAWKPPVRLMVGLMAPAGLAAAAAAAAATALSSFHHPRARRAVALLAVFVFSGIEHEIFHWYVQRFFSGQWFTFFTVHGVLVLVEESLRYTAHRTAMAAAMPPHHTATPGGCRRPGSAASAPAACEHGVTGWGSTFRRTSSSLVALLAHMPLWVSRLLTLAVLELTASWWFFTVLLEPGMVERTRGALVLRWRT